MNRNGTRTTLMALAAALLLPAAAFASHDVSVDVRVTGGPGHCGTNAADLWIDFRPDRGAFVALYAAYSDGSVALVFPDRDWRNHWVEPVPGYTVPVRVPRGLRLESVQAVASRRWFDPAECWVAIAPRHHGSRGRGPVVVTTYTAPLFAWSFDISWASSHRTGWTRTGCRVPCRVASTGRDAALPRTGRWTTGGWPEPVSQVKVKAVPGNKTSKSRTDSGEPKRRSRR